MRRVVMLTVMTVALLCGIAAPHASAAATGARDRAASQAAYLAEQLRKNPVYVSDQVPRAVPRSAGPLFAEAAERVGVPVYFMLLPSDAFSGDGGLLASVHDRLRKDGLYVVLGDQGIHGAAVGYGVDVPAEDALRAAQYELPYDAGALAVFERFVSVLTSGDAARRADAAAKTYGDGEAPERRYISATDRRNQGFLIGALLSGLPLAVLLCGFHVLRRGERRHARSASGAARAPRAAGSGRGRRGLSDSAAPGGPAPMARRRPRTVLVAVAVLSAVLVSVGGPAVFDETRSGPGPDPTAQDMRARVERVAEGLQDDPFYADPESPDLFDAAEQRRLRQRLTETDVPVYVAAVPSITESATAGDEMLLAEHLHKKLDRDGVYVIADTSGSGTLTVSNYGAPVDDMTLYDLPEDVAYPSDAAYDVEDRLLPERLGRLLAHVAEAPKGPPGEPYYDPEPAPDAVAEDTLPPLMSQDFWPGLTVVGPLSAVLLLGLTAVTLALAGGRRTAGGTASGPHPAGASGATSSASDPPEAPGQPAPGWLRRTVRGELDALSTAFDAQSEGLDQAVRERVWDCLDAARLLVDENGDHRVDDDATPVDLACALTLVRVGGHALATRSVRHTRDWCAINPLHGAATANLRVGIPGFAKTAKVPLCGSCQDLSAHDRDARPMERAMLRLPGPAAGPAVRYDELDGPVQLFGSSTDRLVTEIREYIGVH